MKFFFTFLFITSFSISTAYAQVPNAIGLGCDAWSIQNVDVSANDVGKYNSITASDANNIFISYYDETDQTLKLAMSRPSILNETILWDIVTPDPSANNIGRYNDIAVTNNSNIYLSYYDSTDQDLIVTFTQDRGINWTVTTVASTGDVGKHNKIDVFNRSLTLNEDKDIAYISYINETDRTLVAATNYSTAYSFPLNPVFSYRNIRVSDTGHIMDVGTAVSVLRTDESVLTTADKVIIPQLYAAYNFTNNSVSLYEASSANISALTRFDTYTTLPHTNSGTIDLKLSINILDDYNEVVVAPFFDEEVLEVRGFVSYISNDTDLNFAKLIRDELKNYSFSSVEIEENIIPISIAQFNVKKENNYFPISYINYTGSLVLAESRTKERPITVGNSFTTEIIQLADQVTKKLTGNTDIVVIDSNTIIISFYDDVNKNLKVARSLCR